MSLAHRISPTRVSERKVSLVSKKASLRAAGLFLELAQPLVQELRAAAATTGGHELNIARIVKRLYVRAMLAQGFGATGTRTLPLDELSDAIFRFFDYAQAEWAPPLREKIITEMRSLVPGAPLDSLVGMFFERHEGREAFLADRAQQTEAFYLIFGSLQTRVPNALNALYTLATHPDAQDGLRAALQTMETPTGTQQGEQGPGFWPGDCKYLDAVGESRALRRHHE